MMGVPLQRTRLLLVIVLMGGVGILAPPDASAAIAGGGPAPSSVPPLFAGLVTSTTAHGVRLTLRMPRKVYPWRAIAQLTVRVDNISPVTVRILPATRCSPTAVPGTNPRIVVWTATGHPVFPPALQSLVPPQPCQPIVGGTGPPAGRANGGATLAPGAHLIRHFYAILRGPLVRANVAIDLQSASGQSTPGYPEGLYSIFTPFAHLRFARLTAQRLQLVPCGTTTSCLRLTIPSGAHVQGPMLVASVAERVSPGGTTQVCPQRVTLEPWSGRTIRPGCSQPTLWRVVAGYLNEPVATDEYRAQP